MKRRLYYLADNLDVVDQVAGILHAQGTSDWNFHVLSKDEVGLHRRHLHSATPLQTLDLWRLGERGALIGFILGIVLSMLIIGAFGYFQNRYVIATLIITALMTMHGAWAGGLAGMASENFKIKRFHDDIDAGRFLLMIDVAQARREEIRRALAQFPLEERGDDSLVVLPFSLARR